jgi:hypothetical protein
MKNRTVLYYCRHCKRPVSSKQTRGLCWSCRTTKAIRTQYAPIGRYGEAGARQGQPQESTQPPRYATRHMPGTEGRIAVYEARVEAQEDLWHPNDAPNHKRINIPMLTTIFFDMDGVLADFYGGACKQHGREVESSPQWDFFNGWGITAEDFWSPLRNEQFWSKLRPLPRGIELFKRCVKEFGKDRVGVLSSGQCSGAVEGKRAWLREHLPEFAASATFAAAKEKSASRFAVLVDDHEPNIAKWKSEPYCGRAVLYPAPWNRCAWDLDENQRPNVGSVFARIMQEVRAIEPRFCG